MIKKMDLLNFKYKRIDPEKYMHKINYNMNEDIDMQTASPFGHISDSSRYIKTIRKKTWRRYLRKMRENDS
ncbi:MAG: hypothetical protein DRJ05_10445 [Bacteroidetes bacterium]|nr:MAG: hypothetical protein DRJ05_10445 [Bacteroidota bacterium]